MDDQKFSLFPTPRDPTVPLLRKLFWREVIELPLTGGYFCRRVGHEVPTLTALGKGDDVTDGVGPTEDGHQAVQPCTENFCNGPLTHIYVYPVLWVRIRSDPELFPGSGKYFSGS